MSSDQLKKWKDIDASSMVRMKRLFSILIHCSKIREFVILLLALVIFSMVIMKRHLLMYFLYFWVAF